MATSTDVNLPKEATPIFPDRCIACGAASPASSYRASTRAIGWWTLAFWSSGRRHSVDVPACDGCKTQLRKQRWFNLALYGAAIVPAVFAARWYMGDYDGPFKRWIILGIVLVVLLPVLIWDVLFPQPFDMTAFSKTVDYEFRDPEYAAEFAAMNPGSKIEKK